MYIEYKNNKVNRQCTDLRQAKKDFPSKVAEKLIKMITFIEAAENLESVLNFPTYRFHHLKGHKKGLYAMDIDGRKCSYRLIVAFDEQLNERLFSDSSSIEIIQIEEVSKHYE
ncbi:hypothetical protein A5886_000679 [Enterococcus sp. 8G7_MSG3316]|uniref:Plasmid maintenance system killer protein n=1 Tax=Candidatus Enterococcus testudinis TaxID=1834191 RepID=A0A242A3K5_9ENTE|nr:type II toxin-antitoxin system RelE/ParE family toxin [Enterococcus sp. 8G7_MSG3316]OTN75604.1 hypothetical protein A5886_000679 [Enterococcus sp. 8G7_MSG3316]